MPKVFINILIVALSVVLINATLCTIVNCYISLQESKAKINTSIKPRAYQIELNNDHTVIYDGDRIVGKIPFDSTSHFDKLMMKDNE